jgi:uncharacterized protein YbcI
LKFSDAMVQLYKNQFGRGPTTARTHWSGPDAMTCFLEDTLTPTERNHVKMGEHQRLRDLRLVLQYAGVRDFCEPVERSTGRTARSFHSSTDTEVDGLSVETFIFYKKGQTRPRAPAAPSPRGQRSLRRCTPARSCEPVTDEGGHGGVQRGPVYGESLSEARAGRRPARAGYPERRRLSSTADVSRPHITA